MFKIKMLLVALLAIMLTVGVGVMTSPADATRGCKSKVVKKADAWGRNAVWMVPSRWPRFRDIRLSATAVYLYCPNGRRVTKVKPLKIDYCHSHLDSPDGGIWFQGTAHDVRFSDDNTDMEPHAKVVPVDHSIQNCRTKRITPGYRKWISVGESAHWVAFAKIKRRWSPDTGWYRFYFNGNRVKYFHPQLDPNVGRWHW